MVESIVFSDTGEPHNARGAWFNVDNFCICGGQAGPARWQWRGARDVSGVNQYDVILSQSRDLGVPGEGLQQATSFEVQSLDRGTWYLYVRPQDGAGNWGPVAQYIVEVL